MGYAVDIEGGILRTKSKEAMEKVKSFLSDECIYYSENIKVDEETETLVLTVSGGTSENYHESAYQELADLCSSGSCLQFIGEDTTAWTLYLEDGKITDHNGMIIFDMTDPKELIELLNQAGYTVRKNWAIKDPGTSLRAFFRDNFITAGFHTEPADYSPEGEQDSQGITFNIGFINPTVERFQGDGIANDETQFTAESLDELEDLYEDFCKENGFPTDTVTYVEVA